MLTNCNKITSCGEKIVIDPTIRSIDNKERVMNLLRQRDLSLEKYTNICRRVEMPEEREETPNVEKFAT